MRWNKMDVIPDDEGDPNSNYAFRYYWFPIGWPHYTTCQYSDGEWWVLDIGGWIKLKEFEWNDCCGDPHWLLDDNPKRKEFTG